MHPGTGPGMPCDLIILDELPNRSVSVNDIMGFYAIVVENRANSIDVVGITWVCSRVADGMEHDVLNICFAAGSLHHGGSIASPGHQASGAGFDLGIFLWNKDCADGFAFV